MSVEKQKQRDIPLPIHTSMGSSAGRPSVDTSMECNVESSSSPPSYDASDSAISPPNTGNSQLSKFQIFFDDSDDFQFNKPITAQLRRYSSAGSSLRSKCIEHSSSSSIFSSPQTSPFSYPDHFEYFYTHSANDHSFSSLKSFNDDQYNDDEETETRLSRPLSSHPNSSLINRSNTFPMSHRHIHDEIDEIDLNSSRGVQLSRGKSFVPCCKKCQHSTQSQAQSQSQPQFQSQPQSQSQSQTQTPAPTPTKANFPYTFSKPNKPSSLYNTDIDRLKFEAGLSSTDRADDIDGEFGNCSRHHHRRSSIAIKFKNPQVIKNAIDSNNR